MKNIIYDKFIGISPLYLTCICLISGIYFLTVSPSGNFKSPVLHSSSVDIIQNSVNYYSKSANINYLLFGIDSLLLSGLFLLLYSLNYSKIRKILKII